MANVVEAVDVLVTEKTAYGDDEPTATLPALSIWKKVEEADSRLVKRPKESDVASVPPMTERRARPVEVPKVELKEVDVARRPGSSAYEERDKARA